MLQILENRYIIRVYIINSALNNDKTDMVVDWPISVDLGRS